MAWCVVVEPCTLRECRIALGKSQAAFAAMLGASPESYRTWDAGRRATPPKMLARARALATHRDDHARVLADADIDLVSICSYDDAHAEQVLAALEAGKHVFVEKPLCVTRTECDAIRAAHAVRPHLELGTNLVLWRSPRFVELRRRIRAGDMGTVYLVEGDYNYGRLEKLTEGRCCMNTLCRWGGVARTSLDPPQEPHYGNEVESSSHV